MSCLREVTLEMWKYVGGGCTIVTVGKVGEFTSGPRVRD
jgi:hypothetical protein